MTRPTGQELADALSALWPFARSLTRDDDAAADLLQDAWERAQRSIGSWRADAPLGAWLRRIVHNLAVDRHRRSDRELPVGQVEERWRDDAYTVDAASVAERIADRDALEDALVRLPFDHRAVVLLHDVEGWTAADVAGLLEISLPAAKQRLRRGRMMLVTALAEGEERRHLLEGVPMRCWDARRHVSDYLDGVLDAPTSAFVETHLASCPTCPPLYAALVDANRALGDLRDPDSVIPPAVRKRLRGRATST